MKVNKASLLVMLPMILIFDGCDTSGNVENPTKNYYVKYIGKQGNQTGVDFEVNADGTMILLGTTWLENAPSQLWVVKTDPEGKVIWDKELGGPLDDEARDVELTNDGRIVILGNSYRTGTAGNGSRDIFVATLNMDNGNVIKSDTIGYQKVDGTDADEDATSVTQTSDGFVIAGSSDNLVHGSDPSFKRDGLITRLYDDLSRYAPTWTYPPAFGQGSENVTAKIFELPSGGFYAFGYSKWKSGVGGGPQSNFNFWYFPIDQGGGTPDNSPHSFGSANLDEKLRSVSAVPSALGDGFFLAGTVTKQDGTSDAYMGRLHNPLAFNDADPQFGPATLGFSLGKLKNELVSACISQTSEFYLLTNDASSTDNNNNFKLAKISASGNTLWSTALYGGAGDDFIGSVRELPDGKVAVFGTMSIGQGEPKMVLIKVNKEGEFAK